MVADISLRLAALLRERLRNRNLLELLDDRRDAVGADSGSDGAQRRQSRLRPPRGDVPRLTATLASIQERIYERVGHPFNINSPPQLGEVLFNEMALKKGRRTKTGYSTDNEILEKLRGEDPDHRRDS